MKNPALAISLLLSLQLSAQQPFFQNYSLLKKNEPVNINVIIQDNKGYIWCGTDKGLFRFDGLRQKHFSTAQDLPDNNITALTCHSDVLWIGHANGMVSSFNGDSIIKFEPPEGHAGAAVSDIEFDTDGNMWFSTIGDGLYCFSQQRLYRLDETDRMPDLYIYDIEQDGNGRIWAGSEGGIAICSFKNRKPHIETLNYANGLPDNIIKKIVKGERGTMWLATESAGIQQYDTTLKKCSPLIPEWDEGSVNNFLLANNQFWIACEEGLLSYDIKNNCLQKYGKEVNSNLPSVNTVLKDNEGNIWAGTATGLLRTAGDFLTFITPLEGQNNNVTALTRDNGNRLWFINNGKLFMQSFEKNTSVVRQQLLNTPYANYPFISVYADYKGTIWAGTYGKGLVCIRKDGRISCFLSQLTDGNVLSITGNRNEIWLATLNGATKITIDEDYIFTPYGRKEGLSSEYIYQVYTDSKKRTWFATDGKGICMLDKRVMHHYMQDLEAKVIFGFCEDTFGNLWANVQGYGICRFNGKEFEKTKTPFTDSNINSMTADSKGNLVLLHDLGIDIFDVRRNSVKHYGEHMGIKPMEAGLNAIWSSENEILFGTNNGIISYKPSNDYVTAQPIPVIDGVKISNVAIPFSASSEFSHHQNDFTITFQGFWYQNPADLTYSYKLDNYDKEWITGKNHFATYSSLPPGSYSFRVRTSHNDIYNEKSEATFHFTIKPPFWKTTWFYLTAVTSVIVLIVSFIKFRERKLQHDKKVLEEKNNELKKINMELDRFVYSVSHDLRAPLLSMQGVVEITTEITEEELTKEHMQMLGTSISRLDYFIREILDYSRNARMDIKKDQIDFNDLTSGIISNLKHVKIDKRIEIKTNITDNGMFYCDRERLSVILNNLVSNSIRYQKPDELNPFVSVQIQADEVKAVITVEDNGIGIQEEYKQKVFEMFFRGSETSNGSGLGLYIVKETVDKLKGNISLITEPGKGSAFSIEIPNLFYQ